MAQDSDFPPASIDGDLQVSPLEGSCGCRYIRYRMLSKPLVVHACHCRWCQRETGSAFALNAVIEANRVVHTGPEPILMKVPSESGKGQILARCPQCNVVVWSNYDDLLMRFVRVGTLDQPERCPPDLHEFTTSKQPWVVLPESVPVFEDGCVIKEDIWSEESLKRMDVFKEEVRIWQARKMKGRGNEHA